MTWIEPLEAPPADAGSLPIQAGHTMLLDEHTLQRSSCLSIASGLVRVGLSRPEQDVMAATPLTLGFLQTGDHLPLDLLRSARLHLLALTPTRLHSGCSPVPPAGSFSLHEWTVELLLIRQQAEAEQRLAALLRLLITRLGRRLGDWYELRLPLTHADLAELTGLNRVTVTRQLSKWRDQGLVEQQSGPSRCLRLAPPLVEPAA